MKHKSFYLAINRLAKRGSICCIFFLTCFLTACASKSKETETGYHKITAEEAKEMLEQKDVILIDVRTAEEYIAGHIPNAMLIPNETINSEKPIEQLPDKDAILLIYCRSGNRSKQAADKLVDMGYKNVYDFGGIKDWSYETEEGEVLNDE